MAKYEIPLSPEAQKFNITVLGVTYGVSILWNYVANCWVMDVTDSLGNKLLSGIPLVTGTDLLAPYGYMNFGGQLTVETDFDLSAPPTYDNLGITGHMYFTTT